MTNQYDDALYRNPDLARFYDMDNEWRADFDVYLARAASAARILDLGCGTGTLMAAIAAAYPHKTLVGADPAQAMLAIAQQKQIASAGYAVQQKTSIWISPLT